MDESTLRRIESDTLAYARIRSNYSRFAEYVANVVSECCDKSLIHKVEHRSKEIKSFERKCKKEHKDGPLKGTLLYKNPLSEITDFSGIRVIVFVKEYVDIILDQIGGTMDFISPPEDVGERVYSQKGFGYQSKHVLAKLGATRRNLGGNIDYIGMTCEIQVRTILQHAWAEIEHDIQYKSEDDIPHSLRKRFSALAGLLEIGDNEFQAIEREGKGLKEKIKSDTIDELTKQSFQRTNYSGENSDVNIISIDATAVRDLINSGNYYEAIDAFNKKIEVNPKHLTLYAGRARIKFLTGDVSGALQDLDKADQLAGGANPHTSKLRGMIKNGAGPAVVVEPLARSAQIVEGQARAKAALEKGDGIEALDAYLELENNHWNKAFSIYGKALACAMESDTRQARDYLAMLQIRPSTVMAINISSLICAIDMIEGKDFSGSMQDLKDRLDYTPDFTLELSPIKSFFVGVKTRKEAYWENVKKIKDVLTNRTI